MADLRHGLKDKENKKHQKALSPATVRETTEDLDSLNTECYVKKWMDYTNKYGIGYRLSNDSFGVYFNDNTKIVL